MRGSLKSVSVSCVVIASGLLALVACGKDSGLGARSSVWDNYDFRHPVPYNSPVPESQATTYDRYQDYEQDYVPPKGYYTQPPAPPVQPRAAVPYSDYEEYYVPPRGPSNYNPCIPGDPGCIAGR